MTRLTRCLVGLLIPLTTPMAFCSPDVEQLLPPSYVLEWGGFGSGGLNGDQNPGLFDFDNETHGIAIGLDGLIYVSDIYNDRIQVFNQIGEFQRFVGSPSNGTASPGTLDFPSGLAFTSSGNLLVVDTANLRVQELLLDGTFVREWGNEGDDETNLHTGPRAILVAPNGDVYIASGSRIIRFSAAEQFISWWAATTYYALAMDSQEGIFGVMGARVMAFSSEGFVQHWWGQGGTPDGMFLTATGIAIDSQDRVYISDYDRHQINVFATDGTFLTKWGSFGTGPGEFDGPTGIAIDATGSVYVIDSGNNRIQKFGGVVLDSPFSRSRNGVLPPQPNPARGEVKIGVSFSGESPVAQLLTGDIFDVAGRRVRTLQQEVSGAGVQYLTWDGRDEMGRVMPSGLFFIRVLMDGTEVGMQKIIRVD